MGDNVTETLAAPVGTEAQRIGAAVRERRLALGISQKSLAMTAALPAAQTVSEIEKGDRELKAVELVRVARALHVEPSELLGVETRTNADPRVLWRRGSRPLDRVREAQLLERARRYAQLEQWCNEVAQRRLPDYEFNPATATYRDVEHLAARVREEMKLGPVPERTLLRSLEEDFGVKVFFEHLDAESDGDCSAACVRSSEFGAAILMNAVEVPWRRLFSFAHELFHLVTWTAVEQTWAASGATGVEEPSWYKRLESYADTFAANVLMPEESLTSRFDSKVRDGKISRSDIVQLAVEFGVSTQALVFRLETLRRLSRASRELLLHDSSMQAMRKALQPQSPPVRVPLPERFETLARSAYLRREVGKSIVAKYLERSVAELADLVLPAPDVGQAAITVT
jgi:Zn-dependent peptidase ImmA (M78 family)/DNA-binding XRE family transcriptional regulator